MRYGKLLVTAIGAVFVGQVFFFNPVFAADLCQGLITDKLNHPMTTLAKPGLLQTAIDPQFGTTIRRISNAGTNHVVKPMYSTIPAWNADESLMILYHTAGAPYAGQHVLYDGKTYQLIRALNDTAADLEQIHWDPVDPNFFYYPSNYNNLARFIKYDIRTDTETVLHNFALAPTSCPNNGSLSFGSDPQYMSWEANKKVVGLQCGSKKFAYNISTDTVLGIATISSVNAPVVAPSGNLMFLDGKVYDTAAFSLQRTLPMAVVDEHASIGRKADGTDVYNTIDFDGSPAGNLISWNLQTGAKDPVISEATGYPYPITGTHISSIATQNPGFVSVDMIGSGTGQTLLDNEIVVVDLNTDRVCRAAHHHSADGPQGYWAEPHANISPSGTRIVFASDWGGTNTVDTYVLELPAYFASQGPDTTPPSSPTGLAATATNASSISVSWTASTDNVGVTGYQVERCLGLSCSNFAQVGTPTASPFADSGLTANTGYSYHVRAVDAAGNVSSWSNVVGATTPAPDTQAPSAPSALSTTAASSTQINLTWTASTDNVGVTGYQVERCSGSACSNFSQIGTPTSTSYSDTGLATSTLYRYRVRATDAAGNFSAYSNISESTTPAETTPPILTGADVIENFTTPKTFSDGTTFGSCNLLTMETAGSPSLSNASGKYLLASSPNKSDGFIIRSTNPLPSTYKVSVDIGNINFDLLNAADEENGAYFVSITNQAGSPQLNDWWHSYRKVMIDTDNNVWGDGGTHPVFFGYYNTNATSDDIFYNGTSNAWNTAWESATSYDPTKWYTFEIEKTATQYLFKVYDAFTGTIIKQAARNISNVRFPSDPDYLAIGDPHTNYYNGSMKIANIRITNAGCSGTPTSCNTVNTTNFSQAAYNSYGAPFDAFQTSTNLLNAKCNSADTHTINLTTGVTGDTTRIVYTKGYYYDPVTAGWTQYSGTCNGALNGEWCQGSISATITNPNISTASASNPTYLVGMTCSVQGGSWKCGCRDTTCANFYWQVQGAGQ